MMSNTTKDTNPKDAIGIRKAPISTLPIRVLWRVGLAMLEGALKYGRHNYRSAGVRASVYIDAAVGRYIFTWWEGQDNDPDSGMNHIDKAIAALMVMRDSMLEGNFVDDRPPRTEDRMHELNGMAGALIDKHRDKNPRHYTIADTCPAEPDGDADFGGWIYAPAGGFKSMPSGLHAFDVVEVMIAAGACRELEVASAGSINWSIKERGHIVAYRKAK